MPEKTQQEVQEKKRVELEIYRKDGKTWFRFKIDPRIEKLYKELAQEVRDSGSWQGLRFYFIPEITENEEYQRKLGYSSLFDDYGTGLIKGGKLNIAWIRTEGGEGEIQVKSPVNFAELSILFRNAVQFIKEHWENNFRDFKIKGTITAEI